MSQHPSQSPDVPRTMYSLTSPERVRSNQYPVLTQMFYSEPENVGSAYRREEEEGTASRINDFFADQSFHSPDNAQVGSVQRAQQRRRAVKSAIDNVENMFLGVTSMTGDASRGQHAD